MLKYFQVVMDLLEMNVDREKYIEIAKLCEENKDEEFLFFHRHAFLFHSFLSLMRGQFTLEDFMATGDVSSQDSLLSFSGAKDFSVFIERDGFLKDVEGAYIILDKGMIWQRPDLDTLSKEYGFSYLAC